MLREKLLRPIFKMFKDEFEGYLEERVEKGTAETMRELAKVLIETANRIEKKVKK